MSKVPAQDGIRPAPRPRALFAALTLRSDEGILAVDAAGCLLFMNPAAERLLRGTEVALRGRKVHDVVHSPQADGSAHDHDACPLLEALQSGREVALVSDTFACCDGAA